MKRKIRLSVIPTFWCNLRCSYCFVKHQTDFNKLDLSLLKERLDEVQNKYSIEGIDVYGGEVTALPRNYLKELSDLLYTYCSDIYTTTNLYSTENLDLPLFNNLSISFNEERTDYNNVFNKCQQLNRDFGLSVVVLNSILNKTPEDLCNTFIDTKCKWVTFLPYSPNLQTAEIKLNSTFEKFLEDFLVYYLKNNMPFMVTNLADLELCTNGEYNPFKSSHVYIGPDGKYGHLVYIGNKESFNWVSTLNEYERACDKEILNTLNLCSKCKYIGRCYAEHLNPYVCNGNPNLLEWYENDRIHR